jgi:hypothetical protein
LALLPLLRFIGLLCSSFFSTTYPALFGFHFFYGIS